MHAFNGRKTSGYPAFFLLLCLVLSCYLNSLNASWQYDDFPNIVNNPNLHMERLTGPSIKRAFVNPGKPNARRHYPNLSFAFNWYLGRGNVFGYHVVNILFHFGCAWFIYLSIYELLLCRAGSWEPDSETLSDAAMFAACLWAIHPIQTQAVTYVVQRMAVMGGFFYMVAFFCYLRWRRFMHSRKGLLLALLVVFFYLLALGSKENTALFPLAVIACEGLIFRNDFPFLRNRKVYMAAFLAFLVALPWGVGIVRDFYLSYQSRSFTMWERVLTEMRVIWSYMSQIFLPLPHKFSLVHDVAVSKSLFDPAVTFAALLGLAFACIFIWKGRKKYSLVVFSFAFFFINHLIESSIIPLQIIFEHRNYLPTMFLGLPVAMVFLAGSQVRQSSRFIQAVTCVAGAGLLLFLGMQTVERNAVWKTEKSLWSDVMLKAPGDSRPYQKLAQLASQDGKFDVAVQYYQAAIDKRNQNPRQNKALIYNNLGNIELAQGNAEKALEQYDIALTFSPEHDRVLYNKALALIEIGEFSKAMTVANTLMSFIDESGTYVNLIGFLHLKLGEYGRAVIILTTTNKRYPGRTDILLNLAIAYDRIGETERAERLLNELRQQTQKPDAMLVLALLEHHLRNEHFAAASDDFGLLLQNFPAEFLFGISRGEKDNRNPVNYQIIQPFVTEKLKGEIDGFAPDLQL